MNNVLKLSMCIKNCRDSSKLKGCSPAGTEACASVEATVTRGRRAGVSRSSRFDTYKLRNCLLFIYLTVA